jgi:hypothetical protein
VSADAEGLHHAASLALPEALDFLADFLPLVLPALSQAQLHALDIVWLGMEPASRICWLAGFVTCARVFNSKSRLVDEVLESVLDDD